MPDDSKKLNAYDEYWLRWDMQNMGCLFEFSTKYCLAKYKYADFDVLKFMNKFMRSRFRREMETGHPKLLSQAALDSFVDFIEVDMNGNIGEFIPKQPLKYNFADRQLYWVGWAYAYIHYTADIYSSELVEKLPVDFMLEQYHLGHEMDIAVFYDKVKEALV